MLRFYCQFCSHELNAEDDRAGEAVVCPGCKARARVPAQSEAAPLSLPESRTDPTHPNRRTPAPAASPGFVARLIVASVLLMVPALVGFLTGQPWLGAVSVIAGALLCLFADCWFLSVAFGDSALQGFLCLLVPLYALIYLLGNFEETKRPFFTHVAGLVVALAGSAATVNELVALARP